MENERMKILQMVADGIITTEEANQLLNTLQGDKSDFSFEDDNEELFESEFLDEDDIKNHGKQAKKAFNFNNISFKSEMLKAKEELIKAKDRIAKEMENVNVETIKEKLSQGLNKIDNSLGKIDKAIIRYTEKFKNNKKDESEE